MERAISLHTEVRYSNCMIRDIKKSVLSPLVAVAVNIFIIYVVCTLARVEFLLENLQFFREALEDGSVWRLMWGGIVLDTPGIFYTNALWILMMLLPIHQKERPGYRRVCKVVFIVCNALALFANLADSVYFPYTMRRTTADVFSEFSGENNIAGIFAIEIWRHWYLVLLFALLVWGMWKLYVSPAVVVTRRNRLKYYLVAVASLCAGAVTVVSGIRGGLLNHWYNYVAAVPAGYMAWHLWRGGLTSGKRRWWCGIYAGLAVLLLASAPVGGWRHRDIRPLSLSSASAYVKRPVDTALVLNTPFSIIRSAGKTVFSDPGFYSDKEQLRAIYDPLHSPGASAPDARRRNVVVIIVESFGKDYIGALNEDIGMDGRGFESFTPFVDSLINHSAVWRHSFSNGRKSIDGMPSVLASIPMFIKPFVLTPKALNHIDGLPAHLRGMGYATAFFHGARTGSMGFDAFAGSIGFERYSGREDFESDPRHGGSKEFDGYWAIWDEPYLQYFASQLSEMRQPFMASVFTASSHHPFRIPEKYEGRFPEGTLPIHKCIGYTDNALRRFFETARKEPWFDNTIFVITADHSNESAHAEYCTAIGGFEIPVIFYDPSGEFAPGMRRGVAQQIDIMPTLLSYLGYPKAYLAFGRDLYGSDDEEEGWAVNYLNGVYQYVDEGYVLQFDGRRSIGLYCLEDRLMETNLCGRKEYMQLQLRMEAKLKAIIQSYMDRMTADRLTAVSPQ